MKTWWLDTAWPWIRKATLDFGREWWDDMGEHPGLHFASMCFGIVLITVLRVVVG